MERPPAVDAQAPWLFEQGTLSDVVTRLDGAVAAGVIAVEPLGAHCGAEVRGVDLRRPLRPEELRAVRDALLRHKVVVFKEQRLDNAQHVAMARQFGELSIGHIALGYVPGHPEIFNLRVDARQKAKEGDKPGGAAAPKPRSPLASKRKSYAGWHTDITCALNPPAISMLRADSIPASRFGDTRFINTAAACAELDPRIEGVAAQLRGVHYPATTWPGPHAQNRPKQAKRSEREVDMVTEHPLVTVHPETRERVLNVSPAFLRELTGVERRDAEQLLGELQEHAVQDKYMYRHHWSEGDVVFWDNRATLHLGPTDLNYAPRPFLRDMYRVTVRGQPLLGVDGKASARVAGRPILEVSEELTKGRWSPRLGPDDARWGASKL